MNAKTPPQPDEAGENDVRPLEVVVDELAKRFDPVPQEVVDAARRAFDRRAHEPESTPASSEHTDDGGAEGVVKNAGGGDSA